MKHLAIALLLCCMAYESHSIPFCRGTWTRFYDRDNPSGNGDYENLSNLRRENPGQICQNPTAVDAKIVGTKIRHSGQVVTKNLISGFFCENKKQKHGGCRDYEVRYCCPTVPSCHGSWTRFYDRDNPSGNGDYENLSNLRRENPGQICQNPTAVDAKIVGTNIRHSGQVVTKNLVSGFFCENKKQKHGGCRDYEVRYCCPTVPSCHGSWTRFYDRDNPSGNGDYENLSNLRRENPGQICQNPTAVDAKIVGTNIRHSGQVVTKNLVSGFFCENKKQKHGGCRDYEVRYCCPTVPCCHGSWTRFYDRDNPSGNGDYENLSNLRRENPGQICQNPTAVDAKIVGTNIRHSGQVVTKNLVSGFFCENKKQKHGGCRDYEVRYCCPTASRSIPCCQGTWTRFYDRDNPSGNGDYENLSNLQRENPGQICQNPTAVDAKIVGTNIRLSDKLSPKIWYRDFFVKTKNKNMEVVEITKFDIVA